MEIEIRNYQLVDPYIIKKICPEITSSVDDSLISGFILDIQEAYIESILGETLYQEILGQHSGNTLTTANSYLYNTFITKIIAKRIAIRIMYSTTYQFENSGIRVKEGTGQSRSAEPSEIVTMKQFYESEADRISQNMLEFMYDNINDYKGFYNTPFYEERTQRSAFSRISFGGF